MRFLLDTDICIHTLKRNRNVLQELLSKSREDVAICVMTEAELRAGAAKSASAAKTLGWSRIFCDR